MTNLAHKNYHVNFKALFKKKRFLIHLCFCLEKFNNDQYT